MTSKATRIGSSVTFFVFSRLEHILPVHCIALNFFWSSSLWNYYEEIAVSSFEKPLLFLLQRLELKSGWKSNGCIQKEHYTTSFLRSFKWIHWHLSSLKNQSPNCMLFFNHSKAPNPGCDGNKSGWSGHRSAGWSQSSNAPVAWSQALARLDIRSCFLGHSK